MKEASRAAPLLFLILAPAAPAATREEGTLKDELRNGADELYSGATEQALARFQRISREEPSRPEGPLFASLALWRQLEADPLNPEIRRHYLALVEEALRRSEPLCSTETRSRRPATEGCLYYGLVFVARARIRALEGARRGAAADARQAKRALDRAVELNPGAHDALVGLGLYNYYAARLPRLLRLLRFLLFLPGGNREKGLAQLEAAAEKAELLGPEALVQLHHIYLYYEMNYPRALATIEELLRSYPDNPDYYLRRASLEAHFLGNPAQALETCRLVLQKVAEGHPHFHRESYLLARYTMATALFRAGEVDRSLRELKRLKGNGSPQLPLFQPTIALVFALYAELSGRAEPALYREAAHAVGSRERLRVLEPRLRSVLPSDGLKALEAFSRNLEKLLQAPAPG